MHGNYTITPTKDLAPLNGVSTYDLVLISKHILGVEELDSPYKMIAADVNKSGNITAGDMVQIRQLILNMVDEFPSSPSWRFVDGAYQFPDLKNPWSSPFPEVYNITDLTADMMDMSFVGVKIGDINGNAVPNSLIGTEWRNTAGTLKFQLEDQLLPAGEEVKLAFNASDFKEILGYQFALQFNKESLEFVDLSMGELTGLTEANFGLSQIDAGVITTSWNDFTAVTVEDGSSLFELTFKAKTAVRLSEALGLSSRFTTAEAYNKDASLMDIALQFGKDVLVSEAFELYQNRPNPFQAETTIGFNLPKSGNATITVYDLAGRSLYQLKGAYNKGYNEIKLDELGATGVLYYRLDTDTDTATKKMIIID